MSVNKNTRTNAGVEKDIDDILEILRILTKILMMTMMMTMKLSKQLKILKAELLNYIKK
jgi:hypothetical protein